MVRHWMAALVGCFAAASCVEVPADPGPPPDPQQEPAGNPCVDPIAWSEGSSLPIAVDHHHAFVSTVGGPALYVIGGIIAMPDTLNDAVWRAAVRDDGSLDDFEEVGFMPVGRAGGALLVEGTTVIVAGGADGLYPTNSVVVGTLSPDGRLDEWSAGPRLPGPRFHPAGATVDGIAYVVGGVDDNGDAHDSVFYSRIEDGALQPWQEGPALPEPRSHHGLFVADGALFVSGGVGGNVFRSAQTPYDDLLKIPLGADGPAAAERVHSDPALGVATHATTYVDGCFLLFGGGVGRDFEHSAAVHRFGLDGVPLDALATELPAPLVHRHQVPTHDGVFFATGGRGHDGASDQVFVGKTIAPQ